jgi:6-phosphogluconolactonase (cycloisomerase 2 family)
MKFKKFGKALLMSALSAGVVLGVTSCVQSYSVGYLYVTGTTTSQSSGNGIISGFKIDHNTGKLLAIHGLPISSGGANPVRAVLLSGGRFLYVLNRGVNSSGGSVCTTSDPCKESNITQFVVGGNGILTPQETFYTQGINPFRILSDGSAYLYVLDHDSPSSASCALALGSSATACGDITVFKIDSNTGRLSLVINAAVTSASGASLSYFPVPANPIDFVMSSGYVLTLSGTPTTGDSVFPYSVSANSTGQLTVNQNSSQPLNIKQATAIVAAKTYIYVLDNESGSTSSSSQILPFSVGTAGALQSLTGGAVADDPTLSNPIYLILEAKTSNHIYVANQGNNTDTNNTQSGIAGYVIDPSTQQLSFIPGQPFGTGAGPQCIVEDPSNQFVYTANYNSSTITGRAIDSQAGVLNDLTKTSSYSLTGPPTWCLVTGRTN